MERSRGLERLIFCTDAVVAIAITSLLLVGAAALTVFVLRQRVLELDALATGRLRLPAASRIRKRVIRAGAANATS